MKTSWTLLNAALAAGHLMITGADATPLPGSGMAAPARADFLRVQADQPPQAVQDRMARLWQHRAILQDALQQPGFAEPLEPPSRALRPPEPVNEPLTEPMVATAPLPEEPDGVGQGQVTCEDAAGIVADFGFSDIGTPDCRGELYRFSAMRDGTAYSIGISSATGEIAEVSRQ